MTMTTTYPPIRRVLAAVVPALTALTLLVFSGAAQAQPYPNKSVTIVVPFAAGGATDILARVVGQHLGEVLGQPVVVDNKPGAGGNIGGAFLVKSAPDGYTLYMGAVGTQTINPFLYKKMSFDPIKDMAAISRVANVPNLLVAHPGKPYKTVPELIAYAKANPGKVNFGSSGSGTSVHLSGELFKALAKVEMTHVPYKGSGPAMADLLGGQIDIMFDNMPSALPHVKAGKLVPLAVTTSKRAPELPDTPTIGEFVKGYEATSWFGLFAPVQTPAAVIRTVHTALGKVMAKTEVQAKLAELGAEPVYETPKQFDAFIAAEASKWRKVVQESGASVD
jgi:tripartite-type tricarboxylate transporter receptor subunit TctC